MSRCARNGRRSFRLFGLAIAAGVSSLGSDAALARPTAAKVVIGGDVLATNAPFAGALSATIGPAGHVVVICTFAGSGAGQGVLLAPSAGAAVSLIARSGEAAPGTSAGVTFATFTEAWPDSAGRVIIVATLAGTGVTSVNSSGIWLYNGTTLSLVARRGNAAPGLPAGATLSILGDPAFANGRIAFAATASGGGLTAANNGVIYTFDASGFTLVARTGSASGVVAGATWTGLSDPVINASGAVAFQANVSGSTAANTVIVGGSPGALVLAAREGSAAPGAGSGVAFSTDVQASVQINGAGELMFDRIVAGTGVTASNDHGLWRKPSGGSTSLVSREGDALGAGVLAPHVGPDFQVPVAGGLGVAAWRSSLTSPIVTSLNDTAILRVNSAGGAPNTILREGLSAPGEPAGVVFGATDGTGDYAPEFCMNASGQMLIRASVSGGGLTGSEGATRFWGNDPAHSPATLFRILSSGDQLSVTGLPGVTTASLLNAQFYAPGGTQSGRPCSINDAGNAVMRMAMDTGAGNIAGVFVTSIESPASQGGACCTGATCSVVDQATCLSGTFASFAGDGTACNPPGNFTLPCCFADFNQAGGVTVQDIFDYLAAYFAGDPRADMNAAGGVSVQDVFDYLAAYFAGCA